jgi:hypothetical protein
MKFLPLDKTHNVKKVVLKRNFSTEIYPVRVISFRLGKGWAGGMCFGFTHH